MFAVVEKINDLSFFLSFILLFSRLLKRWRFTAPQTHRTVGVPDTRKYRIPEVPDI
jgi:hypothetical protein